ncbi:MAG: RagB/SusD family nutrient uptake outer membrane protein, partial [Bacteroidota bacterium]
MKKTYLYISLLIFGVLIVNSCSKSFIETPPLGTTLESNYYKTPDELFKGLVSCYDPLGTECGKTYSNKIGPLNSASDDCYAGGGSSSDVPAWQVWNNFTVDPANGIQADFWSRNFTGVARANYLLTKIHGVPGLTPELEARYVAECKFLRAYFYFDLVRLFRNVPLFILPLTTSEFFTVTQANPADVYALIEQDLKDAISSLPETVVADENGRATKMA